MASETTAEGLVGSLLETLAQDTHIESNPQIQPDTSADKAPIKVYSGDIEGLDDDDLAQLPDEVQPGARPPKPVLFNGTPIPDLRFEQTYLTALNRTDWSHWSVFRVTLVDFLLWPMLQGAVWALALNGFRYLRTSSNSQGKAFGLVIKDFLNIGGILD
ncbi:hypothetical protein BCR37DRAFT_390903 [Protomyces lactucae-debilis]|uniref:DUF1770-domain-containing protein n=1 Tax=Protomyces lactucae-debilis TaxID=2754530 RepID=A0A1Y2FRA0_PROLT|nr:uncharacterized protein BCR37DRAFT_390903 [Protomyces lactucae-debilis]ORY86107.1 hypothetical protein BCR37DRAFT_390903 [Protomyces lactucae-debilis]